MENAQANQQIRKVRCIVTGFDPFGEYTYNPSQLAVEALPESINLSGSGQPIELTRLVLPTCCQEAWITLSSVLSGFEDESQVVIMSGLGDRRARIGLERFALNIRDYRIPDNRGHKAQDEPIDASGPEAIRTRLLLPELLSHLTDKGYLCEISNHAGSFICNELFYRCLRLSQLTGKPDLAVFVHLPQPQAYADVQAGGTGIIEPVQEPEVVRQSVTRIFSLVLEEIARYCCLRLQEGKPESPTVVTVQTN